jgi:hypothetical protein
MGHRPFLGGLAIACAVTACGAEQLPPPAAPPREIPKGLDLPEDPPAPGTGRVIVEANGERASVEEVTGVLTGLEGGRPTSMIGVRPLCTTPCVVDLPYGSHPLVLRSTTDETRQSTAELDVGPRPKVFRHALGERNDGGATHAVGVTFLSLGVVGAITGALLWGIGSANASGLEPTGKLVTGVSALSILIAVPILIASRPTEQPGATTEWTLPSRSLQASSR